MRCLLLSRYSRMGASSRLRHLQYLPSLAARGIEVDHRVLLDDDYLRRLYGGSPPDWPRLARAYLQRIGQVLRAGRYDLLWIEKELFPLLPAWAEAGLGHLGVPYVVDYDDATFHFYDQHPSPAVRALLGRKIDTVMRHAALVVAGNRYLAERAERAGAPWVEVLPTVVELARYPEAPERAPDVFTVGWIGTPSTVKYLHLLREALHALRAAGPVRLVSVGAAPELEGVETVARPWSEETEAQEIRAFDVGVMPLADEPWERGKCGYKLIQYMASGRPVVASPVGVNRDIVAHGVSGFLAEGTAAWTDALERLRSDPGLRKRMGEAGRRRVEAQYCLEVAAPRLAALLHACLERAGRRSG